MYDSVITLVSETVITDEYGNQVKQRTEHTVFAQLRSIGQSECYQAQAVGLKPDIKFVLPDFMDYQGEKLLIFSEFGSAESHEYSVLRTYRKGIQLELVCARGVNDEHA